MPPSGPGRTEHAVPRLSRRQQGFTLASPADPYLSGMRCATHVSTQGEADAVAAAGDRALAPDRGARGLLAPWGRRLRWASSWILAIAILGVGLPRAVDVSWHGVLPVLRSVHWPAALALVGLWLLGLYAHSFVLTAAAPNLSHRRALTLNVTGSAVSNVVPLGGAAGVELNRRMMRSWGIDARTFTGYTFLTNLWDAAAKLLLPTVGLIALARAGESVTPQLQTAALAGGVSFLGLAAIAATLLASSRWAAAVGRVAERLARRGLRLVGRDREVDVAGALLEVRRECAALIAEGWLRMSLGITGYIALQYLLLGVCLQVTGGGSTWVEVLAAFAVERLLTVVPLTPGGVGVADLGLVSVLLALGGDPVSVTAAAVLYRVFIFAVEIPVGGGALGVWLLGQRLAARRRPPSRTSGGPRRIAHVTDVFLPRLGGIESHVDDLVRHQRAGGIDAQVLTPTAGAGNDPAWVRRLPVTRARRVITDYDVVHVHVSILSPYGITVARAAAAAGIPTLVTVHSMWTGAGVVLRLAAMAGLRHWPVAWSAVSGPAAAAFRRCIGRIEVAVLPNAIDIPSWRQPVVSTATTGLLDRRRRTTVVSVMRLAPRKRPMQMLRVFEQARRLTPDQDLRLIVVGDGPLRGRMDRYLRRSGLDQWVRITGQLSRPEVLRELRSAAMYVAPAPKESFGIAALEARCAGLPVVASRHSGITEFVRDRVEGILVDDDAEMAVAIADLAGDQELRARITVHNRRVAPDLDWTGILRRTDALYRSAADLAAAAVAARTGSAREPVAVGT